MEKERIVIAIGCFFLVIATGINIVNKELGTIAFTVAGLFGLIPIGRKAIRLAKKMVHHSQLKR